MAWQQQVLLLLSVVHMSGGYLTCLVLKIFTFLRQCTSFSLQMQICAYNLMLVYTEQFGNPQLEIVWKMAGTFRKHLVGDWMNHLSITG